MKVCIIQPPYSVNHSQSESYFEKQLELMDQCDESMDLIVMPESCDTPCLAKGQEQRLMSYNRFNARFLEKARETARRCNAVVCCNARSNDEKGLHNTTYTIDRQGNIVGKYFKQQLTPGEYTFPELDHSYVDVHTEPTVVEIEGVRYGFLVCYDAYFYEGFANMARYDLDAVIVCSHQRSDTHQALQIMSQFLAYNTNAYVIRSSVSMGEDSPTGGASMIVAPDGTVLTNLYSKVGLATAEIDPKKRYLKPAGFGNPDKCHHHYIEAGRRPWKYRNGGAAIVPYDDIMAYPRICAHRGFNSVAPENSLPAYGAAVAMGAQEIEFDLWPSKDGVIVSIHDPVLDRVSDGTGNVWEYTYEELLKFDFGIKKGPKFAGMRIPTLEEILQKFAGHAIMNIHVKSAVECPVTEEMIAEIARLLKKYDCERWCYFMQGSPKALDVMRRVAPHIPRCAGHGDAKADIVQKAIDYGCKKVQLYKPYFPKLPDDYVEVTCRRAHEHGIIVNVFYADDPEEAKMYLQKGADTILTNDFNLVSQILK